jgi:hypothetical protein
VELKESENLIEERFIALFLFRGIALLAWGLQPHAGHNPIEKPINTLFFLP